MTEETKRDVREVLLNCIENNITTTKNEHDKHLKPILIGGIITYITFCIILFIFIFNGINNNYITIIFLISLFIPLVLSIPYLIYTIFNNKQKQVTPVSNEFYQLMNNLINKTVELDKTVELNKQDEKQEIQQDCKCYTQLQETNKTLKDILLIINKIEEKSKSSFNEENFNELRKLMNELRNRN